VANGEKKVPREYINEAGNHITEAMKDYVRPLVMGEVKVKMADDGLPEYVRFNRKPVQRKCNIYSV